MANVNYYHPHVAIKTTAKRHSVNAVEAPDTTIMFAPIVANKGKDGLTKVHTLSEFISEFGAMDKEFYKLNGQMAYNIYNWLSNGGTLLAYKIKGTKATVKDSSESSETKTVFEIESTELAANDPDETENGKLFSEFTEASLEEKVAEGKTLYLVNFYKENGEAAFSIKNGSNGIEFDTPLLVYKKDSNGNLIKLTTAIATGSSSIRSVTARDNDVDITVGTFTFAEKEVLTKGFLNAKYSGNEYNVKVSIAIETDDENNKYYTIDILDPKTDDVLERFLKVAESRLESVLASSEYIDIYSSSIKDHAGTFELEGGAAASTTYAETIEALENFWKATAASVIRSHLESPIDIIFDAGYPKAIKELMIAFIRDNNGLGSVADVEVGVRPDIFGVFDRYYFKDESNRRTLEPIISGKKIDASEDTSNMIAVADINSTNIAVYDQYFMINDAVFNNEDIYVTPTYFLSKLIAYNDINYGIQLPTAGLRRAILDDALFVNFNPTSDEKEMLFLDRINYVEKTSREYSFMSQRTADASTQTKYTALSFVNNSRCLLKMADEVERIARQYLHEYNDAVTISNMSNALNKYLAGWVSNRALSLAYVDVAQSTVSENALVVTMNVKFNNTIEVISVDIVIE